MLCWNKAAPYSVRIIVVLADSSYVEPYKVEFADLSAAMHQCSVIIRMEENGDFYEDLPRAKREHNRGWIDSNPRKYEIVPSNAGERAQHDLSFP